MLLVTCIERGGKAVDFCLYEYFTIRRLNIGYVRVQNINRSWVAIYGSPVYSLMVLVTIRFESLVAWYRSFSGILLGKRPS